MGIVGGKREDIHLGEMHRHEGLARLHDGSDHCQSNGLAATRAHDHPFTRAEPESRGIDRIEFDPGLVWGQFPEHGAFIRA